jgi:signal transduction histidine kinase
MRATSSVSQTDILREAESIAQLGSWVWELETNRLTGTEELWRIFDLPANNDAPIKDTFLVRVHSADYEMVKSFLDQLTFNPESFERDFTIVRADRSERLIRAKGKLVCDYAQLPFRMFGTLQDITELKLLNEKHQADLIRMFQNFAHQIRGPAAQALVRAQRALDSIDTEQNKCLVRPVRGLCRKVVRVTFNLHILAEMEQRNLNWRLLDTKRLTKLLSDAAQDAELTIEDYRNVRFSIDKSSFPLRTGDAVRVDHDLLEQCIGNIFDNAAKYSYAHTAVRVYGGYTGSGHYQIGIASTGIRLTGDQARLCIQRGWRSQDAQLVTGEGNGIGLYVVSRAMKAMGGQLVVIPTEDNVTEFKLTFPILKQQ